MIVTALGWAVVHSLWQWTLIAGVAALVLGLLAHASARARYAVAITALAAMGIAFAITAATGLTTTELPLRRQMLYAFNSALAFDAIVSSGRSILQVAGAIWIAGVVWGLIGLAREWSRMRALAQSTWRPVSTTVRALGDAVGQHLHLRCAVELRQSASAAVPMVLGARRPVILLPHDVEDRLTSSQLRSVLAHELAHVGRRDFAVNALQLIVDAMAFHHPAARWISRTIRTEREYCCDDIAAATEDPSTYAWALAHLEDGRAGSRLAVAAASGTLLDRVERIVGQQRPPLTAVGGAMACALATVVGVALLIFSMNVPPPWVPAGVRLRRPPPPGMAVTATPPSLPRRAP